MPDYEAMYKLLFNTVTDAIKLLQTAQQDAEEISFIYAVADFTFHQTIHLKNI